MAIQKAAASGTTVPTASQMPELPARPPTPAALSRPAKVMTGR